MLVLACLLAAAVAPGDARAAFSGANGRVSFSSQGDIYTVTPDGEAIARLTNTPDDEAQSAFSPDGTRIAYRRRPAAGQAYQVYVMNADSSDQHRVSNSAVNETQPGWSPDGRRLLVRHGPVGDPNADVWEMDVEGSNAHAVINSSGADERYPVFSPDGSRIAFASNREGQYELYVSAADGTGTVRLTTDPGYDSAPSWSPDGRRVAFERGARLDDDPTKDIWVMGADGSGQTQLTFTGGVDEGPAFAPDGTELAFTSGRDGNYEIYRMNADGSAPTRLTNLPTMEESPDWQALPIAAPATPTTTAATDPLAPASALTPSVAPPVVDRDRDGLSAARERRLHTSDLDRDSDDDGVSDGREARRTHTRPDLRDTDRDGLTDGVELGVREPVADPPGPVRGTVRSRFRADADPRTRTSPRRGDADHDGRLDGREDANHNGRRDRGETDPVSPR